MTDIDQYQHERVTAFGEGDRALQITICMLGIQGESGEIAELVKKMWDRELPIDLERMLEEIGDLQAYIVKLAELFGFTMSEVLEYNTKKLNARYPNGFNAKDAKP